jgi:hypothetical protein
MNSFLCNTSGSGKTRLLLEGLWQHWGLYFTANPRPEDLGSRDVELITKELAEYGRFKAISTEEDLVENRRVAIRRFLVILYVRLYIFGIFLQCAQSRPGGISDHHKGRWLLLQVASNTLLGRGDVFVSLSQILRRAPYHYLLEECEKELANIRRLLGLNSTIFCVLDEAQIPTDQFMDYLRSAVEPHTLRPIIHEILCAWGQILRDIIISGTSIPKQQVETVLTSLVAKEGNSGPVVITDTGTFDNSDAQQGYLAQYLPPDFLTSVVGRTAVSRAGHWLYGR